MELSIFFVVRPRTARIDMAFTISATAASADETFKYMKDIIKYILDKYGTYRIHYGLIIYGSQPSLRIPFKQGISNATVLKMQLEAFPRSSGGSDVDKAIAETKALFRGDGVRPDARKVAVIITDNRATGDREKAKAGARDLESQGIKVNK